MGFRTPLQGPNVAVRGVVVKGTVISGIRFYSNDATVFPEVSLVADADYGRDAVLRSVKSISVKPGNVSVTFPPYEVQETGYYWAIVRLPDNSVYSVAGAGGGPAIGLRDGKGGMFREESYYWADEGFGKLGKYGSFDIDILAPGSVMHSKAAPSGASQTRPFSVSTAGGLRDGSVSFSLALSRSSPVVLNIYNVAGRRIVRLVDEALPAGTHTVLWHGIDGAGRKVGSGIYMYRVEVDGENRSGKVVLLR